MHGSPDRSRAAAARIPHFAETFAPVDEHIQFAIAHLVQSLAGQNGRKSEPQRRSRKRKLPKHATRTEVASLLAQPNLKSASGLRDRCMMELMYRAGLRVGEVVSLEPRDVYIVNGEGRVRVTDGKGGDGTAYFDPASVWALLRRWKTLRDDLGLRDCPWLFCTVKASTSHLGGRHEPGRQVSTRSVQQMMSRRCRKAGIARITPHMLRHTFATELLDEGFHVRKVQALMRHANLATTEVYLHLGDSELGSEIAKRERNER